MKKLMTAICLFLSVLNAQAEALPSLAAISTPQLFQTMVANDKFPTYLEQQGDYQSAALEWQRVVYETSDANLRSRALYRIAGLYHKMGAYEKSIRAYQRLLTVFPNTKRQIAVLYQISRLSDLIGDNLSGNSARSRLVRLHKDNLLTTQAELHNLWAKGLTYSDNFANVYTKKATLLKTKLLENPVNSAQIIETATMLSLIPGVGYMYLGYFAAGILILAITASFFYAVMTAMKAKHWGYGFVFGSFASFIYIIGMFHTSTLATETAHNNRLEHMQSWKALQPKHIHDFSKKPKEVAPSIMELIEFFQASNTHKEAAL
ncbi:MAG: tetratricopeptide (TPR) repeat protein [Alphaproteobacteria bacterium]|jgi:tetratricopeptide (TPR) repeat protein